MFFIVCFMLSAYTTTVESKSIFILAGQSNMAGQGGVTNGMWDGVVPPQCHSNLSILRLNADLTWEEAGEPLHQGIDDNTAAWGVGPGMPFANSLLETDPTNVVGLVPCARSASTISDWSPGSPLYNRLVYRSLASLNGGGVFRAILWYQGESDTRSLEQAENYKARLEKFITDVRSDLLSPLLPVIQVALASGVDNHSVELEMVRRAQLELETKLQNVKCVDAKGLQLGPDKLHLTTTAQVQLGTMMADTFLKWFT